MRRTQLHRKSEHQRGALPPVSGWFQRMMQRTQTARVAATVAAAVVVAALLTLGGAAPADAAKPIIPDEPVPLSPLGGTLIDTTPTFTWCCADDAVTYELRISKGRKVIASAAGIATESWTSPVLPIDTDLTWKVRGISGLGKVGPWSSNQPLFRIHPPVVGDVHGGGLVAYVLQPGDPGYVAGEAHGLIVGPYPWSFGGGPNTGWYVQGAWWQPCTWDLVNGRQCFGDTNEIGTSTDLGTGAANTSAIVAHYAGSPYSFTASIADSVSGNGYSDWYLPSKDELTKFFENKQIFLDNLNAGKPSMNFAGITFANSLASSSELPGDPIHRVWYMNWNAPDIATAWFEGPKDATSTMLVFRSY